MAEALAARQRARVATRVPLGYEALHDAMQQQDQRPDSPQEGTAIRPFSPQGGLVGQHTGRAARRGADGYVRRARPDEEASRHRSDTYQNARAAAAAAADKTAEMQGMVDIAVATSALPMVAMFSLGFSISVLLDPEREMFDGTVLQLAETLALTFACALSVYCITFSLLEFYYVHLVVGTANMECAKAKEEARAKLLARLLASRARTEQSPEKHSPVARPPRLSTSSMADADVDAAGDEPSPARHEEILNRLLDLLRAFNGMRASARNTMWYSLASLLLAAVACIAKNVAAHAEPLTMLGGLVATGALGYSIYSIFATVATFRGKYREMLSDFGYSW